MLKKLAFLFTVALAATLIAGAVTSVNWGNCDPAFDIGSGNSDWWTTYPDQHENASQTVAHPDWILDDLKEKPVMILVHSNNCVPCLVQIPRIESAVDRFGENITYHDVLAQGAGYLEALAILDIYDPDGGMQYVPTTIFITLAERTDGSADVAWHSQTDIMSQEDIDSYLEDAIYYHNNSKDSWR